MKQHGPWKIKSSEVKYRNPWMTVREDQVVQPDGKEGIYAIMIPNGNGVVVLAIDDDNQAYLLSEFRYPHGREMMNVVCGFIEEGETADQAARREIREELGAQVDKLVPLGKLNPYTGTLQHDCNSFLVYVSGFGETAHEATESIKVIKMPFVEAVAMAVDGRITNAESVATILRAAKYLGK